MPVVMLYFILFALSLSLGADYLRPYCPLLKLREAPVCATCGRRGWRVAT